MNHTKADTGTGRIERILQCTKTPLVPQTANVVTHPYGHVHWKPPFEHWPRLMRNARSCALHLASRPSTFSAPRAKRQTELSVLIRHCSNVISQCLFAMFSESFLNLFLIDYGALRRRGFACGQALSDLWRDMFEAAVHRQRRSRPRCRLKCRPSINHSSEVVIRALHSERRRGRLRLCLWTAAPTKAGHIPSTCPQATPRRLTRPSLIKI